MLVQIFPQVSSLKNFLLVYLLIRAHCVQIYNQGEVTQATHRC